MTDKLSECERKLLESLRKYARAASILSITKGTINQLLTIIDREAPKPVQIEDFIGKKCKYKGDGHLDYFYVIGPSRSNEGCVIVEYADGWVETELLKNIVICEDQND